MFSRNKIYLLIFVGFLISLFVSNYYVSKYDLYESSSDSIENHHMIKGDSRVYWGEANKLKEELKKGKNYFKTGTEYRQPYLPPKLIYIFFSLTNLDLYDQFNKIKIDKKKIFFLIFQTIIYYLSLIFFYKELKKQYPVKTSSYIVGFLAFEPTILLFHSSFWSESIFFSIQIIFLTLLIKNSKSITINFISGLVLGLLFLQRSVAMLYIFPIVFYYLIVFKKSFAKPTFFLICGYVFVLMFLGYHNYSRSGVFYVNPSQSKDGFYVYMIPTIIAQKNNISVLQAEDILRTNEIAWIKKNNIDHNKEKDLVVYYNHLQKESLKIITQNPLISAKHILIKTMHFIVLDPLRHVHFYFKYEYKGKPETRYYKSKLQKNLVPYRIFYSFIFYTICFLGLFFLFKNKKKNHLLIVILSVLYFTAICSWIGNTRYFAPCLIYLSILFGNGLNFIINFKKI